MFDRLYNTALWKRLDKEGKFPVIETTVSIPRKTITDLAFAAFFVCVALLLVQKILKNI